MRARIATLVELTIIIAAIHTGANLHGGNPTIFGTFAPQPLLGWVIGLSWIPLIPIIHNLLAPR